MASYGYTLQDGQMLIVTSRLTYPFLAHSITSAAREIEAAATQPKRKSPWKKGAKLHRLYKQCPN